MLLEYEPGMFRYVINAYNFIYKVKAFFSKKKKTVGSYTISNHTVDCDDKS